MNITKVSSGRSFTNYCANVDGRKFMFAIERGWTNRNPGRSSGYKGPCYYLVVTEFREPFVYGQTVFRGHVYDAPLRRAKNYLKQFLTTGKTSINSY